MTGSVRYSPDEKNLDAVQSTLPEFGTIVDVLLEEAKGVTVDRVWANGDGMYDEFERDSVTSKEILAGLEKYGLPKEVSIAARFPDGEVTLRHGPSGSSVRSTSKSGADTVRRLQHSWSRLGRRARIGLPTVLVLRGVALGVLGVVLVALIVGLVSPVTRDVVLAFLGANWISGLAGSVAVVAFFWSTFGRRSPFVAVRAAKHAFVEQKSVWDRGFAQLVTEWMAVLVALAGLLTT